MNNQKLKVLRRLKHLSQSDLADKCGVSREAIRNIENGTAIPKISTAFAIADALQSDVYYLFGKEYYGNYIK